MFANMTKLQKALLIGVPAAVLVLALAIVGTVFLAIKNMKIEVRFDDDAWIAQNSGSVTMMWSQTHYNGRYSARFGRLDGCKTVWHTTSGGKQFSILHSEQTEEGRFKMVLVLPDKSVVNLSEQPSPYVFTAPEGRTTLKLVGEGAKGEVEIEIPDGRLGFKH